MVIEDAIQVTNTSKRLPIVFCLDVSPSMGWREGNNATSMELLNVAVGNFIQELSKDPKARSAAEIAYVTFSTYIEADTEFQSISTLSMPTFQPVEHGGTQMAQAVLRAVEKIQQRREELEDMEIGYYAPFLVMVTDGNPDQNDDQGLASKALATVREHCDTHIGASELIIPFVIGVGDHIDEKTLTDYAKGFTNGYFPIRGKEEQAKLGFNKVFQLIGNSSKNSIHLNASAAEIIHTIKNDMNDLLSDLSGN